VWDLAGRRVDAVEWTWLDHGRHGVGYHGRKWFVGLPGPKDLMLHVEDQSTVYVTNSGAGRATGVVELEQRGCFRRGESGRGWVADLGKERVVVGMFGGEGRIVVEGERIGESSWVARQRFGTIVWVDD
jgi:hypothetical protein